MAGLIIALCLAGSATTIAHENDLFVGPPAVEKFFDKVEYVYPDAPRH